MRKKRIYIFLILSILFSCQEKTAQINNKASPSKIDSNFSAIKNSDTLNKKNIVNENSMHSENSIDSCHKLLILLIKSSSFDSSFKKLKFNIWVENVVNGVAMLQLSTRNKETNTDVTFAWLEMDFNKKELRDITLDNENPSLLKYDSSLFRKIDEHCRVK